MSSAVGLLARRLKKVLPLDEEEVTALIALEVQQRRVAARTELVQEGEINRRAFILVEGWACSYKLVPDGGRQVIAVSIPGDFIGLRSLFLRTSDHTFATVTDVVVATVLWEQIEEIVRRLPRLAAAILWATSRHEATMVEHLVNVGRRSALVRTAHFLLELRDRLMLVGRAQPTSFVCPLNQYLLADVLGLTAVHINRVLRHLREQRLATFRDGVVHIHDVEGLRDLAGYQGGYLDQEDEGRS